MYDPAAIKAAIDLGELAGQKRKGVNIACPFPWHPDKTPSLEVTPAKGLFHCFGCGARGDVIDWFGYLTLGQSYDRHDGEAFKQALAAAAEYAGISPDGTRKRPKRPPKPSAVEKHRAAVASSIESTAPRPGTAEALAETQARYAAAFSSHRAKAARDYWAGRGFDLDLSRAYGVGFAGNWKGADRVTFPLTLPDGEIRQHVGRAVPPHPETYTFTDRENGEVITRPVSKAVKTSARSLGIDGALGGYFNARALVDHWALYLCEGVPDALALIQEGYLGAFALGGTKIGEHRLSWFTGHPDTPRPVFLCLNADRAGDQAAEAIAEYLRAESAGTLEVIKCAPPEGCADYAEALEKQIRIQLPKPVNVRDIPGRSRVPLALFEGDPESAPKEGEAVPMIEQRGSEGGTSSVALLAESSAEGTQRVGEALPFSPENSEDIARRERAAERLITLADRFERQAGTEGQKRACREIRRLMFEYAAVESTEAAAEWKRVYMRPCELQPLGHVGDLVDVATGKVAEYPELLEGSELWTACRSVD